jgi:uncharacterized protein YcsI (UPF0317 family)
MIDTILESFSITYIIAVMTLTSAITWTIQRYVPALTPDEIETAIATAGGVIGLIVEDWKKIVTVAVGGALAWLFWSCSLAPPGVLMASFPAAVVGYSYGWKYVAKWSEEQLKRIGNDEAE